MKRKEGYIIYRYLAANKWVAVLPGSHVRSDSQHKEFLAKCSLCSLIHLTHLTGIVCFAGSAHVPPKTILECKIQEKPPLAGDLPPASNAAVVVVVVLAAAVLIAACYLSRKRKKASENSQSNDEDLDISDDLTPAAEEGVDGLGTSLASIDEASDQENKFCSSSSSSFDASIRTQIVHTSL